MYIETPPDYPTVLAELVRDKPDEFFEFVGNSQTIGAAQSGKYRHWNSLRHLEPPFGLTHRQWWAAIKYARFALSRDLPLNDPEGRSYSFSMPDEALELLHYIDQHAAGEIKVPELVMGDEAAQRQYLANSLIEEAIRSSQLEGADTTRQVAKEMIRSGRNPRGRSEQMILNNYRALQFMRKGAGDLKPDFVLALHRILVEETLDDPDAAGRLQTPADERVAVYDRIETDLMIHQPPPAEQLPERFQLMCDFANYKVGSSGFLHPVVRAILLHFWLAHDHPFEDGNGRTARALFYWSMKRSGYWLTEYLSISRIFREAPRRYVNAFVYSETDGRDATYFVLYHLSVIKRAIEQFQQYVQRKVAEVRVLEQQIRSSDRFNYRQLALLGNAVRNPGQQYTFKSHSTSHNVTFQTARTDLLRLAELGLLDKHKRGKQFVFTPAENLTAKLNE